MPGQGRRAIIVGGGISGVLTALELVEHGWSVDILEAAHVGAGSSSRTAAGIRQQFSTPETVRAMRYAVRAYQRLGERFEGGQSPIIQHGYLFLHGTTSAWQKAQARVQMQREAGLSEVEALEGKALTDRFPWISLEHCIGGTFCPTDGFLLPALVYGEGARLAEQAGARLHQAAPVQQVAHRGDRLVEVRTPKGTFSGDVFFDCTNAWTRRVGVLLGGEALPVDPLKRYLWFIQRDGPFDPQGFWQLPMVVTPSGVYARPENPDTLLMGRAHKATPEPDFAYEDQDHVEPDFAHNAGLDTAPFEAWMSLAEVVPAFGELGGITATTSGYYATTPDHNPFLGYDRSVSNLIRLVGFSGHGAMFGPFTAKVGRALAEAGHDVDAVEVDGMRVPLAPFRIGRAFSNREDVVI